MMQPQTGVIMLVSKKAPEAYRTKVYVTDTEYEIWYSQPRCLGTIRKIGHMWYTPDARSHRSARQAMIYLTEAADAGRILEERPLPVRSPKKKRVPRVPNTEALLAELKSRIDTNDPIIMSLLRALVAPEVVDGREDGDRVPKH